MHPTFPLIAFDLDGTVVDSESVAVPDMIAFLNQEFSIPMTESLWYAPKNGYHGLAGAALLSRLHADFALPLDTDTQAFIARRNERLPALLERKGLAVAPGLSVVLAELHQQRQPLCIASNSSLARIQLSLQHTRTPIKDYFPTVFSAVEAPNRPKPAPDVYLAAARQFGASPAACIAVEDSPNGASAALAAGFITIGYLGLAKHADQDRTAMRALGVSHIINHWHDFLPLLTKLSGSATRSAS